MASSTVIEVDPNSPGWAPPPGLTAEQKASRRIGGSDAAVIMFGEFFESTIHGLWLEKTGKAEPENLDKILRVRMGSHTESLNRYWYQERTGWRVTTDPKTYVGQEDFMTAHLDGLTNARETKDSKDPSPLGVWEAKHTNPWIKVDPVEMYYPQLQHNMAVTGRSYAHLSVFKGNDWWRWYEVERDDEYIEKLIQREAAFWFCVEADTPPPDTTAPADKATVPVAPVLTKVVDMTGNNAWASLAFDWLDNHDAAKKHVKAEKAIRKIVEKDAARTYGHGLDCVRDGRGLMIRKLEND